MPSKRCPTCGLVNPERAERCDCGWSFATQQMGASLLVNREHPEDAEYRQKKPFVIAGVAAMGLATIGFGLARAGLTGVGVGILAVSAIVARVAVRAYTHSTRRR